MHYSQKKGSDSRDFLEKYAIDRRIHLHSDDDSGFDSFLKLIVVSGRQKASRGEKTSRQSSFIFSLVPNSGQVLRKDQDHDPRVFRPLQNRHDLYSALYFISPLETKARLLEQIQSLVDLRESHISACAISLKTLTLLARFQISTDEDPHMLHDFANLFQKMVRKMEHQFDEARIEAVRQFGGGLSGGTLREDALRIMRFNQNQIQNFLTRILRAWSECIRDCRTSDQARYLLFGDNLAPVLELCTRTIALNSVASRDTIEFRDEVIEAILAIIISYILKWLPKSETLGDLVEELQRPLKSILSTQLGRYDQCSDGVLRSLTVSLPYDFNS